MNFTSLTQNIRFYVLSFSILLSLVFFFYVKATIEEAPLQIIKLTQYYALTSVTYLYIALMATPLTRTFSSFPYKGQYIKARRAIGVSAFYFGFLHGSLAFFGQLGGFAGLSFLDSKYLLAITLSFTALIILATMASTSFDFIIAKLGHARWKFIHRFVYLAALLITIHGLMLGSHFQDLSQFIPRIFTIALAILLILEAKRFDNYLQGKFVNLPKLTLRLIVVSVLISGYLIYSFFK